MQFWRDAIKGIQAGNAPHHPVALALATAMQEQYLPAYYLKRIIDARDNELMTPTHMTSESLVAHAESTSSALLYLQLALLSLSSDNTLSHAASHLGVAQTLAILLRALPFHAKHGRMVIPAEITAKHGVRQEEVFREGPNAKGIEDAVYEFATLANDHLITARTTLEQEPRGDGRVPQIAMPAFLTGVPVANYLQRLEKANFNAFEPKLQLRDWKLPWHVWRGYYKRMF
ncbi:Squalene/phytoene synthase [Schizophyllum commune]